MTDQPSPDLLAAASESPPVTPADRLEKLNTKLARVRDLKLQVLDCTEKLTAANKELNELTFTELPDMFSAAGMRTHGLAAQGNLPRLDAELKPYYKANIAADWDAEARDRGFKTLESLGAMGLVKFTVTVEMARGEATKAKKVMAALDKLGVTYACALAVQWNTLTAWLKERYTKRLGDLTPGQLEAIGGKVATVVEVKVGKS
jgi:hypothetical protein